MQIVIDLPEEAYEYISTTSKLGWLSDKEFAEIIKNGTPLPKGHGRLISADSLIKAIEEKAKRLRNTDTINGLCGAVALIFDASTIIETDKMESEG